MRRKGRAGRTASGRIRSPTTWRAPSPDPPETRKMILRPLAALLLAFIALGPGGSAAADPPPATGPLAGIPNLDVQYYEVSGQSVAEIRASLNRVRPRDPNDGLAVDAVNRWYISWRWPRDGSGGCLLARTELRFTATLRMPRLAGPTPPAVRARWNAYISALVTHEAGHLR